MLGCGRLMGLMLLGLLTWAMSGAPASADDKPTKEETIRKAQDDIRKMTADYDKLSDQLREMQRKLSQAYDKLDELEGRTPGRGRFGRGGPGGFGGGGFGGPGGFGGDFRRPEPPRASKEAAPPAAQPPAAKPAEPPARQAPAAPSSAGDLDKKLEKLMRELEDLRREIRR